MGFEGPEGVRTLTLSPPQVEALWDELLPLGAGELPQDLARIDERLRDPERCGRSQSTGSGRGKRRVPSAAAHGRPTIAMETYVRLMVIKQRRGWGYETLVREVSDSLRLRRFLSHRLHERVPDESTRRKLTRRLGAETVAALTAPDHEAHMERRPRARAVRIDSTVVEADVRYPTDAGLAAHGVRALAREGKKLAARVGARDVGARSLAGDGRDAARIGCTIRRRSGEAEAELFELTPRTGELLERSIRKPAAGSASAPEDARARRRGQAAGRPPGSSGWPTAASRSPPRSSEGSGLANPGPAGLAHGSRRPTDPQGQARVLLRERS